MEQPSVLGQEYAFSAGLEGFGQDGFVTPEGLKVMEELQHSGKQVAWKKVENPTFPFKGMTTFFTSANGEKIFLTYDIMKPGMAIKATGNNEHFHISKIGGKDVYYSENSHFLSATEKMKEVVWSAGSADKPINVHLGTESLEITKEELLAAAEEVILLSGGK